MWFPLLVVVASLAQRATGHAQQTSTVPALGVVDVSDIPRRQFVLHAPADRAETIAARYGLTLIRQSHGVYLVDGPDPTTAPDLVSAVSADPDVTHFELNGIVVAPEIPTGIHLDQSPVAILDALSDRTLVDYYGNQAWTRYVTQPAAGAIRLADAHALPATGAGIVAIIDTGVDPTHPLLAPVLVPGYDFTTDTAGQASDWNALDPAAAAVLNQSPVAILDQATVVSLNQYSATVLNASAAASLNSTVVPAAFGHGTMVAGLVHLVAPTAKIMPLKVFAADGSSRVFDIVRAIYYAVDNGARVINMSFSSLEQSPEITHAIDYATDNGVICVSSAGNSGRALLVYPAALRDVIGVGSITSTDPPARSSFSNYGDSLVRVGAPGEGVITTYPGGGYTAVWGTSFSTALVAGGAALLVQIDSALDEHRASDFLGKADKMPKSGLGRGRLDLYEATRQLPDVTQPTIDLVSPASGSTVMNTIVVAASAADNVRVAGVQFLLDNQPLGAEVTTPPYRISWDTTRVKNGTHTLTTIARDASGNAATASVTVVSSNDLAAPTVTMTNPTAGATVSGSVPLTADASDDIEVAGVQFIVDGTPFGAMVTMPPYAIAWSTLAVPNGAHTVTAIARDTAGKETTAVGVTVTVANDKTPPTVALIAPGVGASVSSTVTVAASAADDTALIGVRFLLDGQPLGVEQTTAPYQVAWNTSAVADGAHTITAIARDSAGNETTATAVPVTVANGVVTPP